MKKTEYRACLDLLNLTQEQASTLFRVGDRTGRRWAGNKARIPFAVAALLRIMVTTGKIRKVDLEKMKD